MQSIHFHRTRAVVLALFLTAFAQGHPGSPGHYHPDEVDEFDQVAMVSPAVENRNEYNLGGILVLSGIIACLAYAFFQRQGGIWKDVTANH